MIMQDLQSATDADVSYHCEVCLMLELAPIGVERGWMAIDRLIKNRMLTDAHQLDLGNHSRSVQSEEVYLVHAPGQTTSERSNDKRTSAPGIMAQDYESQGLSVH